MKVRTALMYYPALTIPLLLVGVLLAADDVTPGMNRFTVASYRQIARQEGNLIFSPFSISTALSMLLDGARRETAAGIAAASQQHPDAGYHAAVASLAAGIVKQANTGGNRLDLANGLWVQNGFPIEAAFEKTMSDTYRAPA